ncbi:MAG: HAMP domain-containing histidine kinase [Chloroflexi bacterium]|uniref:sensor histidine kinase n=1 Tax=Candidatus Flexifilum breve TaxID=3140694 RepID=UPI0031352526|nr:HAMP domain-containing histidine kinase [Chloroflexota bacterium]
MTALEQAQALLAELHQGAQAGSLIPFRLPGQIQAIQELLGQAAEEAKAREAEIAAKAVPPDMETFLKEQAGFFGHAIHELRTPMTSIRGYGDMLGSGAMGALNDMQKQFVDTIRTNSRRMESLLVDVSDMNKLRAGTLRINSKMDMFKNIAMMVEKSARPVAESLNKTLTLDVPQGLPLLNLDGELLAKAIFKLVENGLRYSNEDGTVTVAASGEGSDLIIKVIDNGIGMTPEDLARLGEVYFRSENELVRSFKGSGLGVPVAYGLIKLLGGTVSVVSEAEKGTTFTVRIPGMG